MEEKNIKAFEFKKITRADLEKSNQANRNDTSPIIKQANPKAPVVRSDKELIQNFGDKEELENIEEKFQVIDYVFKRDHSPLIICHACGTKTGSKYYVSHYRKKEVVFCPGCYQSLPACDNCGMPAVITGPKLQIVYCQYCKVTKACDCCGTKINAKESNRIAGVKGTFCHSCFLQNEKCVVCNVPVQEDSSVLVGAKKICEACQKRKVTQKQAEMLNKGVIFLNSKALIFFSSIA